MPPPSDARRAFRRDAGPEVGALHLDAALEGGLRPCAEGLARVFGRQHRQVERHLCGASSLPPIFAPRPPLGLRPVPLDPSARVPEALLLILWHKPSRQEVMDLLHQGGVARPCAPLL